MRKLGNSLPKELKSISSESWNLTVHPLLFYVFFFKLFFFLQSQAKQDHNLPAGAWHQHNGMTSPAAESQAISLLALFVV